MIEKIEAIICAGEGILPEEIHIKGRKGEMKEARQIIMYFAKKETRLTLAIIGKYFNQDHATASHAIKTISNYIDTDSIFRDKIRQYQSKINELKVAFKKIDAVALLFESLQKEADSLSQKIVELQAVLLNVRGEFETLNTK